MDEMLARSEGQIMGPRIPIGRRVAPVEEPDVKRDWEIFPSRVFSRASDSSSSDKCSSSNSSNTCEKPTNMSLAGTITVAIM